MLFVNVCAGGSSVPVTGNAVFWRFFCAFGFFLVSCAYGEYLLVSLLCTRLGSRRCASCWTRPLGGGWWSITFVTSGEKT